MRLVGLDDETVMDNKELFVPHSTPYECSWGVAAASWAIYAWIDRPLEKLRHAYVQRSTRGPARVHAQEAEHVSPGR